MLTETIRAELQLNILVVDDHALVREGMRQVLKGLHEQVLVLEASTCAQAFELCGEHPDLDLVLLDFHLPDMNGLDALDIFAKRHPELPVVLVSGSANPEIMRQVLAKGAAGFIPKSSKSEVLLAALNQVLTGDVYAPPDMLTSPDFMSDGRFPARDHVARETGPDFTPRQIHVLQGLMDGQSNRDISVRLNLSEETIKNHVTAILRALKVQTRTQAVLSASRLGFKPTVPC